MDIIAPGKDPVRCKFVLAAAGRIRVRDQQGNEIEFTLTPTEARNIALNVSPSVKAELEALRKAMQPNPSPLDARKRG